MTCTSASQIGNLLVKMKSPDTDFRFMATSDLMAKLQNNTIQLDDDSEGKILRTLVKLLEDRNREVQSLAVNCMGLLINKAKETRMVALTEILCHNIASEKEQLRDISNIALKTVLKKLSQTPKEFTKTICELIIDQLVPVVEMENLSMQLEALDILADVLAQFGGVITTCRMIKIFTILQPKFNSSQPTVRKRTVLVYSNLACFCDSELYKNLVGHLYKGLTINCNSTENLVFIQCLASVCRRSGEKFGEHIELFMPIILQYADEIDDDIREYCIQVLRIFVSQCPKKISSHIPVIIKLCLEYIAYDPNYIYNDDESDQCNEATSEESEDDYSDDEDMSWKIRRASAKCLECVISNHPTLLHEFYETVSPTLIACFKEREENVRLDILLAYLMLLKQTNVSTDSDTEEEESEEYLLKQQVPTLLNSLYVQIKSKNVTIRQYCFYIVKELCRALPGALTLHMNGFMLHIMNGLDEKQSNYSMRIDVLSTTNRIISSHPPEVIRPHVAVLLPAIVDGVKGNLYKITVGSLLVLEELIQIIRPLDTVCGFDYTPFVNIIYNCTFARLKLINTDQEVKERVITTMAQVIYYFGDFLAEKLLVCQLILLDRVRNEITSLIAIRALIKITESPLMIDLPIINRAILLLGSFFRKNQRVLKLNTVTLLNCFVKNYYHRIKMETIQHLARDIPLLIDDSDLYLSQLTFTLLKLITKHHSCALQDSLADILPKIIDLAKSPLLQGASLAAMIELFQALATCHLTSLGFGDLLQMLIYPIAHVQTAELHRQAYYSLAKCVAAITVICSDQTGTIVNQFLQYIKTPTLEAQHKFAVIVVGEIGRDIDLSKIEDVKDLLLTSFKETSGDLKMCASYALACVCIGNLQDNLPFIYQKMKEEPEVLYYLVHSLKDIIIHLSTFPEGVTKLLEFLPEMWQQLFLYCENEEAGTRNIVAECLGKLTLLNPESLLQQLKPYINHSSPLMRTTVLNAVKFLIVCQRHPIDTLLHDSMEQILKKIQDPDINVRQAALTVFNSAALNKSSLIKDSLATILPDLYNETKVKEELIQEIEMGPFKHKVDDGLDVRKTAFDCMFALLDSFVNQIDLIEYLNHVIEGLEDHNDIKMTALSIIMHLSNLESGAVIRELDRIVTAIRKICMLKTPAKCVNQVTKRINDVKKSSMHVITRLKTIPAADKNSYFNELIVWINDTPDLLTIFKSVQYEDTRKFSK